VNSTVLNLPTQDLKWTVSEVFAIKDSYIQQIYNYVSNLHTQDVGN